MLDFYVGQKVVCVDADLLGRDQGIIAEGEIYTIRAIGPAKGLVHPARRITGNKMAVLLREVRRAPWYDGELGFLSTRFRPLIETDISVFTAMLEPTPVRQRETQDA